MYLRFRILEGPLEYALDFPDGFFVLTLIEVYLSASIMLAIDHVAVFDSVLATRIHLYIRDYFEYILDIDPDEPPRDFRTILRDVYQFRFSIINNSRLPFIRQGMRLRNALLILGALLLAGGYL